MTSMAPRARRALLVLPSYDVPGLDPVVRTTLLECGVLPSDLKGYTLHGAAVDIAVFMDSILGRAGVSVCTLQGTVHSRDVMQQLQWLLDPSVDVAVLLFCGHGINEGSLRHGSLVCSYRQLVSAEAIDTATQRFRGTLIRVLNMCEAEAIGPPGLLGHVPMLPSQHGRSQRDSELAAQRGDQQPPSSMHNDVVITATGPFQKTTGNKAGSAFMAALGRMFSSELLVTYERLDELLPKYYPTASVRMTPRGVKGTFGMPAGNQQVRHLNVGHRDGLTSNSDSDGDTDF